MPAMAMPDSIPMAERTPTRVRASAVMAAMNLIEAALDETVVLIGGAEQLEGLDIAVAIDDAAGQRRGGLGGGSGAFAHARHVIAGKAGEDDDPQDDSGGEAPIELADQHEGGQRIDGDEPDHLQQATMKSPTAPPLCQTLQAMEPEKSFWKKDRLWRMTWA